MTAPARADIDACLAYIAREAGLDIALRFADDIDAELSRLAWIGHSGASREWLSPGLRLHVLGNYCIYFRVTPTETRIIRFLHGAMDISRLSFDDTSSNP
ncbi:MAG TPA: type II toxin-antitoxin system RelE/ParE family toxin [Hyphomicrobiaceae bacterium]|nr:type II toxin-antitoxin system RelE/ParE family toxin [Hyphomicrobiaceae bacterium]